MADNSYFKKHQVTSGDELKNNTTEKNKILIVTGGAIDLSLLQNREIEEQYTMIIAADKGLLALDSLNLTPDFIVGDFDSVSEEVLNKYKAQSTPVKTFPTEKDKTDTEIAIELALMHSPSDLDIIGAMGNRMDHVLANIHLLLLPLQQKVNACLLDANNKIYLKNENFQLIKDRQYGDFVSFLPFQEKVKGLTLKGFKYPLTKVTLTSGTSLGISNEIKEQEASVEVQEGILIVIEARD